MPSANTPSDDDYFDRSRTKEILDAELARGGPRPAASFLGVLLSLYDLPLDLEQTQTIVRNVQRAIVASSSTPLDTARDLSAILESFVADLCTIAEGKHK